MDRFDKHRDDVRKAVAGRNLTSVMNRTKWERLAAALKEELPFPPPYQRKDVLANSPEPASFEEDVPHHGDWREGIHPFVSVEWVRVRPRYLKPRGRLVPPEVIDGEEAFVAVLHRLRIPYRHDGDSYWIYGYASDTTSLCLGE